MANNKNITFNQLEASMTKVKAEIDKKANTNHGTHVPTTGTANNATYLRNDNQWHKIVPSDIGAAPTSHGDHVTYSKTSPLAPGTASAGSAANVSRGDHVHPLQTTISGNAGTATKLATARTLTIGNTGKNFDGTGNISWSLDEIGAAPSSHGHNFMYVKGTNTIGSVNDDTTSNWGAQGNSVHWYAGVEGLLHDQPSSWGYLVNIGQSSEVHQIWMTQTSGDLLHRGGNSSGWSGSWRTILDTSNYSNYVASKSHTHTNLVTKTVSNSTLTLGTELYQYAAISSNTTIKLPSVSAFTEIHLFFNWPANVSVTMPSGVKWQQGVMYGPGHVHEFVFTYVNNIGWLGGCVVYG